MHSCDHFDTLKAPQHPAIKVSIFRTHRPYIPLFTAFLAHSTKFAYCKQRMLQKPGNEISWSACSTIQLPAPSGWPRAWVKRRCRLIRNTLAANFASRVGACAEIIQAPPHVTAHPQFLVLELRVAMGACPRQYGTSSLHNIKLKLNACSIP